MTLSDISIKRPVFAWMLMAGLILFGFLGFSQMGISLLPDVDFPVVTVSVSWEGASPEVVETEVTDLIEDTVMTVQGVREVTSSSRQGRSVVSIEFELSRDIDVALQEVQTKIAQAQRNLPKDIDPPVITKTNPEDQPIMWMSLSGERPLKYLMEYANERLKDQFSTISGVGEVFMGGFVDPNLRVWLNAGEMQKRELTVDDIIAAIQTEHAEVPAGIIETEKNEMNVRVLGEASSIEEFGKIIIPGRQGSPIWKTFRFKDVATIEDGLADVRRISRYNGKISVGFGIRKQRGSNAVEVATLIKKRVAEIQKTLPKGLNLDISFDSTIFIEESTRELVFILILSAILTSLVCWIFLGSWSSALNIILAIPTSIVGSFIFLYFLGFTLNTFTLLGLALVIGIVVDDAIMVLENIVRHREGGEPRVKAAITGAREITFAAMAATIAILAIFVPVIFMKGVIGKYFFQFGVTLSVAVLLSLLEALTLAPMRCSQFLDVGHTTLVGKVMDNLMNNTRTAYRKALDWCLRNNWKIIIGAFLFFIGSLSLTRLIKNEFIPAQDQGRFMVMAQTPVGSSMQFTDKIFKQVEELLSAKPEVEKCFSSIGAGYSGGSVNTGRIFITMKPLKDRPLTGKRKHHITQREFMSVVRKEIKGLPGIQRATIMDPSVAGIGSRGFPIEFTLRGRDWDKLASLSETLINNMEFSGMMTDINSDYIEGMPEVRVLPNRTKASERGVSVASIGNAINATVGGIRVGKYTRGGKRYDIRIRFTEKDRKSPADINKIRVRNNHGEIIPMSSVVDVEEKSTLVSITRKNRERAVTITANVAPRKSQGEALKEIEKIAKETLPEGYRVVFSGTSKTFQESFQGLYFALIIGIFVAYMVLASQFNSYIHPFTVLLALPFSVSGAFIALIISQKTLNIYSMIGIILLMGIVKKNSILLVDFTNVRRRLGMNAREALLEACPIRLRPIIMTSVTTIAAAIPPSLGIGPGAETRIPMAVVIIGGVFVSTLLTLFVVPCAYSLLSKFESHRHDRDLKEALNELNELK